MIKSKSKCGTVQLGLFHYLSCFPATADIIIEVTEVDEINRGYSRYVAFVELIRLNDLLDDVKEIWDKIWDRQTNGQTDRQTDVQGQMLSCVPQLKSRQINELSTKICSYETKKCEIEKNIGTLSTIQEKIKEFD